jgi:DNA processing protein
LTSLGGFLYFIPRFRAQTEENRLGDQRLAWVALNLALAPNALVLQNLLERFDRPDAILAAEARALAEVRGVTKRLIGRLKDRGLLESARAELQSADRLSIRIVLRDDRGFPRILLQLPDPPPLLYMRGDLKEVDDPAVAVVGSRRATEYGLEMAGRLASEIASAGVTIVSGLARGIDQEAHLGALEAGGRTLAFLGSGLDRIYPRESAKLAERISNAGAILSEFPLGTPPLAGNFPVRNRLISGVARGTLVVEAALASGSLITARMALEQGREVFAVPGNVTAGTARGSNQLIQQGAKLVMSGRDVLEEIPGVIVSDEAPVECEEGTGTAEQERILRHLPTAQPVALEDLARVTEMEAGPLLAALLKLEMDDRVKQLAGCRFMKTRRRSIG